MRAMRECGSFEMSTPEVEVSEQPRSTQWPWTVSFDAAVQGVVLELRTRKSCLLGGGLKKKYIRGEYVNERLNLERALKECHKEGHWSKTGEIDLSTVVELQMNGTGDAMRVPGYTLGFADTFTSGFDRPSQ